MKMLKVLSLIMDYPTEFLLKSLHELKKEVSQSHEISPDNKQFLNLFLDSFNSRDLMDIQAEYGALFDRGRALSLLLFEHVHGESRDRGQAMVDLMNIYEANGFIINKKELPDYIPLFLEYLSQRPLDEAKEWLQDISHILAVLSARLHERNSLYSSLFDTLLFIAESSEDISKLQQQVSQEERDDTPEAIDKIWEEEAVRFGQDAICSSARTTDKHGNANYKSDEATPLQWVNANSQSQVNH